LVAIVHVDKLFVLADRCQRAAHIAGYLR
jgi:hypothetical protein